MLKTSSNYRLIILFLIIQLSCQNNRHPLAPYAEALAPEQSLESMQIIEGFKVELFASEPYVTDPVEMVFDENGKIYVVEMPDYPFKPEKDEARGKVKILEDRNKDGVIDFSAIFADSLMEATSALAWRGGLIVCAAPEILYFKDNDGDNVADEKKVLFTGFFDQNSEIQITNLRYGLDNWIYAGNYGQKGKIFSPLHPEMDTVEVQGADFRFRLEPFSFEAAPGITQFGHDQDDWGHRLVTQNTVHARHIVIPRNYLQQNPSLRKKQALRPTYEDGSRMYQLTPPPYWRAERTSRRQKRYDKEGKGRIEHASNHFTACSGTTFYLADAFPSEYYGSVFTGDVAGNLIHRDLFEPLKETPSFKTFRAEEEQEREFLASTDPWFRPANFSVGPDGYLYVTDMYRQHIETPLSIPEDLKKHMDFYNGEKMGRIYRILPVDSVSQRPNHLKELNAGGDQLISLLSHRNRWYRLQAQRLIIEKQLGNIIPELKEMALNHPSPEGRLHAIYTLNGLGEMNTEIIRGMLEHESSGLKEHGLKLGEQYSELLPEVRALIEEASPQVSLQAILSFGAMANASEKIPVLAKVVKEKISDEWFRLAVACGLRNMAEAEMLRKELDDKYGFWKDSSKEKEEFLKMLDDLADN